jgi:hypothetical protein
MYRKTLPAARELGCGYHELYNLIRHSRIAPPMRDSSGHFIWTDSDMDRVRQALTQKRMHKRGEGR